ncbi:MAG: DASS family sodium-coupled anion symporter [Paracoccaceae bacterium]|nr:DASS family sodium-coupled anion symporter [Paracoccaceae bacterium]
MEHPGPATPLRLDRLALFVGPLILVAALVLPPPADMTDEAWRASGLAALMALWWLTEAIPLAATALLPIALWPLVRGDSDPLPTATYAHPLIFLFLGGFLLARAIESAGLHRRLARATLSLAGQGSRQLLAAVMLLTGFLSLWVSNTASAMVMMPIAAAVAGEGRSNDRFAAALMLGVAFAATIGGMGSLIGTPPNALFAAYAAEILGVEIGFAEWALVGIPVSAILMAVAWAVLSVFLRRASGGIDADHLFGGLTPMSSAEVRVAVVAALTALAWITRPLLQSRIGEDAITDAGIAIAAAVALFILPAGNGRRLLEWEIAVGLRWDVLILFGGGLALAQIMSDSGLAEWIGGRMLGLGQLPAPALILLFVAVVVLLGELASNTAMAAIFLPVAGAAAVALDWDPVRFTLPIALAASVGFMLPVATPPNAIVFSHPAVTRRRMLIAGAPLDVVGMLVAAGLGYAMSGIVL